MFAYAELRAPFAGVITQRAVDKGQFVTGGTEKPLLVVDRTDKLRVVVEVPELDAALVTAGEHGDAAGCDGRAAHRRLRRRLCGGGRAAVRHLARVARGEPRPG